MGVLACVMYAATCYGVDGNSLIPGVTYIILSLFDNNINLTC